MFCYSHFCFKACILNLYLLNVNFKGLVIHYYYLFVILGIKISEHEYITDIADPMLNTSFSVILGQHKSWIITLYKLLLLQLNSSECLCTGQWGPGVPLLGLVRRSRWVWSCSGGVSTATAPYRLPASSRDWNPPKCSLPTSYHSGRGTGKQPLPPGKHPGTPPTHADSGCLSPRGCRSPRFTLQHSTSTKVLHGEKGAAWESGRRSHWERLQRDGENKRHNHNKHQWAGLRCG